MVKFNVFHLVILCLTTVSAINIHGLYLSGLSSLSRLMICIYDGCIIGKEEEGNKEPYVAWYGIPYASPPVDELRFKRPYPPVPWKTLYDSRYHRSKCMQTSLSTNLIVGSEDCLYLNVYKPNSRYQNSGHRKNTNELLPVMVFLHGGAFKFGGTHPKKLGPDYFMDEQGIIVVTVQYRLGVFGFLASGDDECKGNFGLKDQSLALKWVQENIRAFGGDPRSVTLFGEGAGATSAHFHMMSKQSNDLFKKAIIMSGSALNYIALAKQPQKQFRKLAKIAGIKNNVNVMKSLKQMSARDLHKYSEQLPSFHRMFPVFRPVIEEDWKGAFITEDPNEVWKSGDYQQRPFFISNVGYEQGAFADLYYNKKLRDTFFKNFDENVILSTEVAEDAVDVIRDFYFDGTPSKDNFIKILSYFRDRLYYHPVYKAVEQYTQYGNVVKRPVDLLMFNFTTPWFSMTKLLHPYTHTEAGPSRGDEHLYLFRWSVLDPLSWRGKAENAAKDLMVELFTEYVTRGFESSDEYPVCDAQQMNGGFCYYMYVNRKRNDGVKIVIQNNYELDSVPVMKEVEMITKEAERSRKDRTHGGH